MKLTTRFVETVHDIQYWLYMYQKIAVKFNAANLVAILMVLNHHLQRLVPLIQEGNLMDSQSIAEALNATFKEVLSKAFKMGDKESLAFVENMSTSNIVWEFERRFPRSVWCSNRTGTHNPITGAHKSSTSSGFYDSDGASVDGDEPTRSPDRRRSYSTHSSNRGSSERSGYRPRLSRSRSRSRERSYAMHPDRQGSRLQEESPKRRGGSAPRACFAWNTVGGCNVHRCQFQGAHGECRACGGAHKMFEVDRCRRDKFEPVFAELISKDVDPIFGGRIMEGRFQGGSIDERVKAAIRGAERDSRHKSAADAEASRRRA